MSPVEVLGQVPASRFLVWSSSTGLQVDRAHQLKSCVSTSHVRDKQAATCPQNAFYGAMLVLQIFHKGSRLAAKELLTQPVVYPPFLQQRHFICVHGRGAGCKICPVQLSCTSTV